MTSKAKILAILLTGVVFCEFSFADASIFDRIKEKVADTKSKVMSAKDKLAGISSKAQKALTKVGEVAEKVQENKDKFAKLAGKFKISDSKVDKLFSMVDNVKDKTSAISNKLVKVSEKLGNKSEEIASKKTTETTAEQPGLENSENLENADANEEKIFPTSVVAKIDKLIPSKDIVEQQRSISFEKQTLSDDDIPYLIDRLTKFASEDVKKVYLSFRECSLSLGGALKILGSLKSYPQFVKGLIFSGNKLGDEGAISIISSLSNFPMLNYIFMSDMGISGDGAVAIISVINKMSQRSEGTGLQLIDLSHNRISDEHIKQITSNWQDTKNSENIVLMLQGNPFKAKFPGDVPTGIHLELK